VRESALYHHFDSKAAIMKGLLEELGPGRAAQLDSVDVVSLAKAMGVREMFKSIVHMLLTEWAAPREMKLTRLMVTEGYRLKSEGIISPWQNAMRVRGIVAGIFEKLARAKLIRKVDPHGAAISFMGPLMMLRLLHLGMAEGAPDLEKLLKEVDGHLDFFCDNLGLLNERSASRKGA
jgi:AcrR family transcriptional regulator